MKPIVAILILSLMAFSCAPIYKTGTANTDLRIGDTKQFVQSHYGQPDSESKSLNQSKWVDEWEYQLAYVEGGIDTTQVTRLVFVDNKLVEVKYLTKPTE